MIARYLVSNFNTVSYLFKGKLTMYTLSRPFSIMRSSEASELLGYQMWVVTQPVTVTIRYNEDDYVFTIPKGFLTDGASVPRIFWGMFQKVDETINAAIIHDYLCEHHHVLVKDKRTYLTRRQIDKIFYEVLREDKVKSFKANLMYQACRLYSSATRKRLHEKSELKKSLEAKFSADDYCFS